MHLSNILFFIVLLSFVCAGKEKIFWHITDSHMLLLYKPGSSIAKSCNGKDAQGSSDEAPFFGDYRCDPSPALHESAWNALKKLAKENQPEFIVFGGDSTSKTGYGSVDDTKLHMKNVTAHLKDIQSQIPNAKVFPMLGNHDSYPWHQFSAENSWVYAEAAELWKDFLPADALVTLKKGGYYTAKISEGLRIVVCNTAEFFPGNIMIPLDTKDPGGQMSWIRKTLAKAKADGEKVFLFTHVPPGYDEIVFTALMWKEFNEMFLDALDEYSGNTLVASFYGHVHLDSFRLVHKEGSNNVHAGFLTSSVTPRWWENPSFAEYVYDASSFSGVMDKIVYYADLPASNKAPKDPIKWTQLYRGTTAYGLTDMKTSSMIKLADKMIDNTKLFGVFRDNMKAGELTHNHDCTGGPCQRQAMCVAVYTGHDDTWNCLASINASGYFPRPDFMKH